MNDDPYHLKDESEDRVALLPRNLSSLERIAVIFSALFLAPIGVTICLWIVFAGGKDAFGRRRWRYGDVDRLIVFVFGSFSVLFHILMMMGGYWVPYYWEWHPENYG
jgi:hypothetical protein